MTDSARPMEFPTLPRKILAAAAGPNCKILFETIKNWSDSILTASLVRDHFYLGTVAAAQNVEWRTKHNITHILTVMKRDTEIPEEPKCERKIIPIEDLDWEHLFDDFAPCSQWIDNAIANGGNVLVHCRMGVSRSATMAIAYVQESIGLSFIEAYRYVEQKRNCIGPKMGFQMQLKQWDTYLNACRADTTMQMLHDQFRNSKIVSCVVELLA